MKKSIFALFFALFALFSTPVVYADDLPEVAASDDAPLPPLIDDAIASDTSAQ